MTYNYMGKNIIYLYENNNNQYNIKNVCNFYNDPDFKELISLWILFLATDSYLLLNSCVAYMLGISKKLSRTCEYGTKFTELIYTKYFMIMNEIHTFTRNFL